MKKAKVIIPSLALLSFSALACVTGSVAWFSSITNAHVSTSSFAVRAIVGAMDISVYHGLGTRATLANPSADQIIYDDPEAKTNIIGYKKSENIVVKPYEPTAGNPYELSHGSYDPDTETAYTYKAGKVTVVNKQSVVPQDMNHESEGYLEQGTAGVFNIFTWTMEFDYDFNGAGSGAKNLYIDVDKIAFTEKDPYGASDFDTARGFRLFFLTLGENDAVIDWTCVSPFQSNILDKNNTGTKDVPVYNTPSCYIKDVDGVPTETAFNTNEIGGNLIYSPARDGQTFDIQDVDGKGPHTRKDCVGTFSATDLIEGTTISRIKLKVVACYEGCDDNVTFGSNINAVTSVLDFYVADDTGAI